MISRELRDRIKSATIPEEIALDLLRDIDSAIRHRDAASLRNFAAEAAASGMDQESARAFEIAAVIETKAADELLRIKAALAPTPPTQAQLAAAFDRLVMERSSGASEDLLHQRAENMNAVLRERNRRAEESRRR
jgi:hypothetical protein